MSNGCEKEITKVQIAIKELREAVKDLVTDDNKEYEDEYNLIRWLRAQNMDVKRAEKMLRHAHTWRLENHVEALVYEDLPQDMIEKFPIFLDGFAKDGTPVSSIQAGRIDLAGQVKLLGREKVLRYCTQIFAQGEKVLLDFNRKNNGNEPIHENSIRGAIAIVDFDQFSYRQVRSIEAVRTAIDICKIMTNYFPDLGSDMYTINCNMFSGIAMRLVRPVLETPYLKFHVFGTNVNEWKEAILSRIPADLIRPPFGGTKDERYVFVKPDCLNRPRSQYECSSDVAIEYLNSILNM
ncbi:unnamed protein product [Allacma fusca]|uniref:CRAL-TRIO domain-containing protein n=1 Tax=Allacma fusca TaxID=39272 RepID=A0A8J2P8I8_9HEXA|nr:unnamed protein product [Allacma fusca]